MIRHLFELVTLLLLFGVGIGLLVTFGIGLLLIWQPVFKHSQAEEEYRRVENAGLRRLPPGAGEILEQRWLERPLTQVDIDKVTHDFAWPSYVRAFPFDWERE
jgi:hypothetical protein